MYNPKKSLPLATFIVFQKWREKKLGVLKNVEIFLLDILSFYFRNISEIIKSCGFIRSGFFLSKFVTFGYTLNLWFLISVRTALSFHIFITRCTFLSNIMWWYIPSRNCLRLEFYATLSSVGAMNPACIYFIILSFIKRIIS